MTQENQKNSILDNVLEEQRVERRQQFKPRELLAVLFDTLNKQEIEILRRRYALQEAEEARRQTLEEIGKTYKVTRERIRQLENRAINKLKSRETFKDIINPFETVVLGMLEEAGGIIEEEFLVSQLLEESSGEQVVEPDKKATIFIIAKLLDENLEKVGPDEYFMLGWKLRFADVDFLKKIVEELNAYIETLGKPVAASPLVQGFKAQHPTQVSDQLVLSALELSSKTRKNPFGDWGLVSWRSIVPKRMTDKVYLILEKRGQPMHFREIAEAINKQGFDQKRANPATVHNELIMGERYILVGRGTYALKDWGYKPGVVSEVITQTLREKGPMTREEVIDELLEQRMIKAGTVLLALNDQEKFKKLEDGRYTLVE